MESNKTPFTDRVSAAVRDKVERVQREMEERIKRERIAAQKEEAKEEFDYYEKYSFTCAFLKDQISMAIPGVEDTIVETISKSITEENIGNYQNQKEPTFKISIRFRQFEKNDGYTVYNNNPGADLLINSKKELSDEVLSEFFDSFGFEKRGDSKYTKEMNTSEFVVFCNSYVGVLRTMHYDNEAAWRDNNTEAKNPGFVENSSDFGKPRDVLPMEDLSQEFEDPVFGAFDEPSGPKR